MLRQRPWPAALCCLLVLITTGCGGLGTILSRNIDALGRSPRRVPHRIRSPRLPDARLAVLWVGHATLLVQIDDKLILTDPVFTETVGQFSRRLVEPGIDIDDLPPLDLVVISHNHVDHLSFESLDLLEHKLRQLVVSSGSLHYLPRHPYPTRSLACWQSIDVGGIRVTAVPVRHQGYRYGADADAMEGRGFTGFVFSYHGITVYFGGDTAYDREAFAATAARFPTIHLALLPIGPIEPSSMARANHLDGRQAVRAFADLGAHSMIPIHYDTFPHGADAVGDATRLLDRAVRESHLDPRRVHVLAIGEQRVLPIIANKDTP